VGYENIKMVLKGIG